MRSTHTRRRRNEMKLALIAILAAALGWLLCYGAMRTAERIANTRIVEVAP
jgi:small neutral amino acid transporter SnatA (MarC family)